MTSEEDNTAFNTWAFGVPEFFFYRQSSNMMALELWNQRHSDLLKLEPDGDIKKDLTEMWALWEKHGKNP